MNGGDRGPLLLLSPLGATASAFTPVIGPLSVDQSVILHDHPGHGLVPGQRGPLTIADLAGGAARTLERTAYERAVVCGFGLGGMIALWLAVHRPDRVAGLCVAGSSAARGSASAYQRRAAAVRDRGLGDEIVTVRVTRERAAADPPLMARLAAMVASVDSDSYAACCQAIAGFELTLDVTGILLPHWCSPPVRIADCHRTTPSRSATPFPAPAMSRLSGGASCVARGAG